MGGKVRTRHIELYVSASAFLFCDVIQPSRAAHSGLGAKRSTRVEVARVDIKPARMEVGGSKSFSLGRSPLFYNRNRMRILIVITFIAVCQTHSFVIKAKREPMGKSTSFSISANIVFSKKSILHT